jgi:hypothetical protein
MCGEHIPRPVEIRGVDGESGRGTGRRAPALKVISLARHRPRPALERSRGLDVRRVPPAGNDVARQRAPSDAESVTGRGKARKLRTPQEKKALSLQRDRRNTYGQDDKGPRKGIPLRKRSVNRANRRTVQTQLVAALDTDAALAERVEMRVRGKRPKQWTKYPDTPLGEVLDRQRRRRAGLTKTLS